MGQFSHADRSLPKYRLAAAIIPFVSRPLLSADPALRDRLLSNRPRCVAAHQASDVLPKVSFIAARSGICSASSFLSLAFSAAKRLQPLRLRYRHAAKPGLPNVEGASRHAVPAGQVRSFGAYLVLDQNADDLLVREPRSLLCPSSSWAGP